MLKQEEHKGILPIISFMLGIITYFALPDEPHIAIGGVLFLASFLLFFFCFFRKKYVFFTVIFLFFVMGIFVSELHTYFRKTIFLPKEMNFAYITGEIESIQKKITTQQLILKNVKIKGLDETKTPQKIKMWAPFKSVHDKTKPDPDLTCQDDQEFAKVADKRGPRKSRRINTDTCALKRPEPATLREGDVINGVAFQLNPPATPVMTGGFYQARTLFFENIGATGSFASVYIVDRKNQKPSILTKVKNKVIEKIDFLPADTKGVVLSLLLGMQTQVTTSVQLLYRTLGLTHILSVSGFHVSLITFLIYVFLRYLLTFLFLWVNGPGFVVKRVSAVIALIVAFLYVLLTGAEPPAVRAFLMIFFLFICFFTDREVLSVRTIFVVAFLLLCYKPVLILSAGFQLSFVAVLCLSVLVQELKEKLEKRLYRHKVILFLLCLVLLNVLVTFATMPIIAYHFHKIALYSIIGNLLLSFLFSLVVMPLLIVAVFLMPFGLEKWFLTQVDLVLSKIHLVGEEIALLPHAIVPVPAIAGWGLLFFIFGFMLLCIFKTKLRYTGLVLILLAPLSYFDYPKNDIMIANYGRLIALKDKNNEFVLNESYRGKFYSDNWLLGSGVLPQEYINPIPFDYKKQEVKGLKLAFSPKECKNADLTFEVKKGNYKNCPNLFKKEGFKKNTVLEIQVSKKSYKIKDLSKTDAQRPWGFKK